MRTFLAGGAQESLGGVTILEPDGYPLLLTSDLRQEHETISDLIGSAGAVQRASDIRQNPVLARMCATEPVQGTRYCFALIERSFAYHARLNPQPNDGAAGFFDYGASAEAISILFGRGIEVEQLITPLLEWFAAYRFNCYAMPVLERALEWIRQTRPPGAPLPEEWRRLLTAVRGQFADVHYRPAQIEMALDHRTDLLKYPEDQWLESSIDELIGKGPWLVLVPCEGWAVEALQQLDGGAPDYREHWFNLLKHCHLATSARPSAKWLKTGLPLLDAVGSERFASSVISWFLRSTEGRVRPTLSLSWEDADERMRMHELNAAVLRGLLWLCPTVARPELIRAIGKVCFSAFRKIRGLGSRAAKVGNAGIYALGQIDDPLALGQLALLRARVKLASAQKSIEKAFALTAKRSGLSREELDEMSVPTYGLTDVGLCEEKIGNFTARLDITGTHSTALTWLKPEGAPQRSVPIRIKTNHPQELKDLEASIADIQKMLPAQRDRIDRLFLHRPAGAGWPISVWRERYLDHPLVGTLARRLLWEFTAEDYTTTAIWREGQLVDIELKRVAMENTGATVRLWHPIGKHAGEIAAWREWLEAQQIQQPFKQAHREIYRLTEEERQARSTYSTRFAAHVLKQHQFNAVCIACGWKNPLRRMVNTEVPPPSLHLPQWGLRVEFRVEGIGHDYGADGADTNEHGVFLRLATEQLRFYPIDAPQSTDVEPLALEQVPPLVFSEVMRDVDLFIGTASIGNDPTWWQGGPQGRHRQYWENYAFGELNATASTRKEVLQRLVPGLKIASLCQFEERFLVVKGVWRTYKIHLGSGNILMEPNDQYLCLPLKHNEAEFPVLLPFEGDPTLSAIISKAFLLANDTKIADATIVSQIMQQKAA
ncbi:MAG TPA: DUF4132 domain-containing protein [Verrucomicrobiae bacterium]|nr:DUF4132 domain-containing protein [Verrucomicrobiae bacterium]